MPATFGVCVMHHAYSLMSYTSQRQPLSPAGIIIIIMIVIIAAVYMVASRSPASRLRRRHNRFV